jgi:hypothetical protein
MWRRVGWRTGISGFGATMFHPENIRSKFLRNPDTDLPNTKPRTLTAIRTSNLVRRYPTLNLTQQISRTRDGEEIVSTSLKTLPAIQCHVLRSHPQNYYFWRICGQRLNDLANRRQNLVWRSLHGSTTPGFGWENEETRELNFRLPSFRSGFKPVPLRIKGGGCHFATVRHLVGVYV